MLKQYLEFKAKYPDAVILYRVGDFYETFCEDAQTTHDILGITLTARAGNPLAGFPYHALDTYLPKLVRAGKRVAICEQLEDPKLTKKLVKRGVTELITPGLSMGDNVLNARENNFLASVTFAAASGKASQKNAAQVGLALLDISTGEFMVAEGSYDYIDKLIGNYAPKEILFVKGMKPTYQEHFTTQPYSYELDDYYFGYDNAVRGLLDLFHTQNLKGFGIEEMTLAISSAGAILRYLDATQHTNMGDRGPSTEIQMQRACVSQRRFPASVPAGRKQVSPEPRRTSSSWRRMAASPSSTANHPHCRWGFSS